MMKTYISKELTDELNYVRGDKERTAFLSLIRGAKEAGHTYAEIAEPLEVSRSAVNQWYKTAVAKDVPASSNIPERPTPIKDPKGSPRKIRPDVPPKERAHLLETSQTARGNTRWSREDSPERRAAYELEHLMRKHIIERNVPVAAFARHAGVTRRAIMQRLEKIK